ncbi:MAG: DNA polymerase IV, partial [Elusimicrobia bacterium]|nr:DNA polymerase IV [Elusimicrobiota bacterium]
MADRRIVHVDMDAFFAAIEQRDNPALRGRPVIVGADPKGGRGRGVVSTCSYEARKFGVRSAMPISEAWRRCPQGVYLPPDFERYDAASKAIRAAFYEFTPDIEQVSIDEAYLDITRSAHLFGGPLETCRRIKARVKELTRLTCSLGLAPTKLAAKIASDLKKP